MNRHLVVNKKLKSVMSSEHNHADDGLVSNIGQTHQGIMIQILAAFRMKTEYKYNNHNLT